MDFSVVSIYKLHCNTCCEERLQGPEEFELSKQMRIDFMAELPVKFLSGE